MRGASAPVRVGVALLWIAAVAGLIALGTWQVQRRAWKHALIARVEAGLRAPPAPPPPAAGPDDAYRRIVAHGRFLAGADSFVQASTILGPGWWVMTPLRLDADGRILLVNRGYVAQRRAPLSAPRPAAVTGLLRLTEPGGGFLRRNDPRADRWYSRDVAAIAARRRIGRVLPYFIDAGARAGPPGAPVGGLTVISFPDNHLVYAITWYMLAAMTFGAFLYWYRLGARPGRPGA